MKRFISAIFIVLLFVSCRSNESSDRQSVDFYNTISYELRYSDIDSSYLAAKKAYSLSRDYADGRNEALNNLAYVYYQQMKYDHSIRLLRKVLRQSRNQIELLCSDVMMMKVMQRIGNGYEFFRCKNSALNRLSRINEYQHELTERQLRRVYYANTELHIVSSTYYYYLGQDSLANAEINSISDQITLDKDTTQYLYYHYMLGSGGLLQGDSLEVKLKEFDHLLLTYTLSKSRNVTYFEANALQSLAEMFINPSYTDAIKHYRSEAYHYIAGQFANKASMLSADSLSALPLSLATQSLHLFYNYKDLFQTACLYRTIGDVYFADGRYQQAHRFYNKALSLVNSQKRRSSKSIVAWMAGIHERLSLSYSSIGNKNLSDYHRNIYLDLLDDSRQNKELDIRMENLSNEIKDVHIGIGFLVLLMSFILFLILFYIYKVKHHISSQYTTLLNIRESEDYKEAVKQISQFTEEQENTIETLTDECNSSRLHIEEYQNGNIVRRAKVSLVYAIIPYLNRILAESNKMKAEGTASIGRLNYIRELVAEITRLNDVLMEWIKMQKGMLNLHVSTFQLSKILDILRLNKTTFDKKDITLIVPVTDLKVKADEALTLFMVNTLADNARKFTPSGGKIEITLSSTEEYVEIGIVDTGVGLSEDDVNTLNNSNVYDSSHLGISNDNKGFGFGIMNCKGIINKYKKLSSKFAVCNFGVESTLGKGSRFWFRLPRVLCVAFSFMLSVHAFSASRSYQALFDSTYTANVEGRYEDALRYAERALQIPDIQHDTILVVQLRNEMAIASQALMRWDDYRYNNSECVRLHWLYSQDTSLATYCQQMEDARYDSFVLFVLLAISSVIILALIYVVFLKDRIKNKSLMSSLSREFQQTFTDLKSHINALQSSMSTPDADIIRINMQFMQSLEDECNRIVSLIKDEDTLSALVKRIYEDITKHLNIINVQQRNIANLTELNHKTSFEEDRLYVMNQVLDNSLSTIKHETMYYPARIDQMVQGLSGNTNNLEAINELNELVTYYKELYLLLYEQANRQLAQSNFRNQKVSFAEISDFIKKKIANLQSRDHKQVHFNAAFTDGFVRCDVKLLRILIDNLITVNWSQLSELTLSFNTEGSIVNLLFTFAGIYKKEDELASLFSPSKDNFSYYIIRQIVREHDSRFGFPGLRLNALQDENGFTIHISLPSK